MAHKYTEEVLLFMLEQFQTYLRENAVSQNTIDSYLNHIRLYMKWYIGSARDECGKLFRVNILDYIAFMKNIKKYRASTINAKLSALDNYNRYLIEQGAQTDVVINKKDYMKIQGSIANPNEFEKSDIEAFRQKVMVCICLFYHNNPTFLFLLALKGWRRSAGAERFA
jgi:site-specific recombinase XerD